MSNFPNKEFKGASWDWDALLNEDNSVEKWYRLSERKAALLLSALVAAKWSNRWKAAAGMTEWDAIQAFVAEVEYDLMNPDSIAFDCSDVEPCLETSTTIINIENNNQSQYFYNTNNYYQEHLTINYNNGSNHSQGEQSAYDPPNVVDPCADENKNKMWGAVNALVDFINGQNLKFIARIAEAVSAPEQIANAIEAVPILGGLPFDNLLEMVTIVGENLGAAYESEVDDVFLTTVKCEFFCFGVNQGCQLSVNDFGEVIAPHVTPSVDLAVTTLTDLLTLTVFGNLTGTGLFWWLAYFQMLLASLGAEMLGVKTLEYYAMVGRAGDPDTDWEIFCLDCAEPEEWCYYWDFTSGQQGWDLDTSGSPAQQVSHYSAGNGFYGVTTGGANGQDGAAIRLAPIDPDVTITEIVIFFNQAFTGDSPQVTIQPRLNGAAATFTNSGSKVSYAFVQELTFDDMRVIFDPKGGASNGVHPVGTYVIGIRMKGEGTNPFGEDNC